MDAASGNTVKNPRVERINPFTVVLFVAILVGKAGAGCDAPVKASAGCRSIAVPMIILCGSETSDRVRPEQTSCHGGLTVEVRAKNV